MPSERWELVAGVRLDADSQFGVYPAPSLAARFDPADAWTLRASVGRGYRAPSFRELLLRFENQSVNYVVEGNPELGPETSIGVNTNAEWRPSRRFGLTVNLFYNRIDNLIAVETVEEASLGGPTRFSYINIDEAFTRGVESTLQVRPWAGNSIEAAHTLLDTCDLTLDRQLEGRSRHRVSLTWGQRIDAAGLEATVRAAFNSAQTYYIDTDGDEQDELTLADPYTTLDARIAGDVGDHVTLFIGGENLLNAGDPQFLPLRPRRLYAGLGGSY
ncbi:MAG: TonB-dependent receptor, partial [Myxococcota bacterium]